MDPQKTANRKWYICKGVNMPSSIWYNEEKSWYIYSTTYISPSNFLVEWVKIKKHLRFTKEQFYRHMNQCLIKEVSEIDIFEMFLNE